MHKTKFIIFTVWLAILAGGATGAAAQDEKKITPDFSVSNVRLGDRTSAKAFLGNYQARIGEDGRPVYYFFNKYANQVFKLTGASFEDRFFLTELEVYRVGKSYRNIHFQAEKIGHFKTEKDIFIGYKQSKASAITGIPNVDGNDMTGPKTVVRKIGEPTEREAEGKNETFLYRVAETALTDEAGTRRVFDYAARYEFDDGRLKRFVLAIKAREN